MRPLKLKITGFGPYKGTNVIDMERLGRGGLYLITGDTGAGKTFIFDAITYALYGDMSGSGRDSKNVRSQYAADGEKTEVELAFEYSGHKYTVTRNPEYYRAKKSGSGFTKQTAGATLIKPDGSVVDGSSRVNEEIKSILGIDRGQFCNIAMIAQGEFRRVLNAGTDERQRLFRKLFNTQPYSRLSEELKDLSRKNQERYNDGLRSMNLCLSSVSCSFDEVLSAELEEMKERSDSETVTSEEICKLLGSIIQSGDARSASIADDLDVAEKNLTELNNTIALAKDHRKTAMSLEAARNDIPVIENEINTAKEELAAANKKKPVIEQLENEAALIEASMDSYDELDSINEEISGIKKRLNRKTSELASAGAEAEQLKTKLAHSEKQLQELRHSGEDLINIRNSIEKKNDRVRVLESLVRDIKSATELEVALKKQQDELQPLLSDAEKLEAEHSSMVSDHMREQAGILASSLAEGEACPVCGSLHHPAPAELRKDAPSADDIDEKKKEAESAREKASRKMGEAQIAKGNLDAVKTRTCAAALHETGTEDLKEACETADKEIASLNESLAEMRESERVLKEKAAKAKELNATIPEMRKVLEEKSAKAADIEKEINADNASLAAANAMYRQIRKDLAFDSKEDAESSMISKASEAKRLREDIEKASKKVNEAESVRLANDAKINELDKVVSGYKPVDEEAAVEAAAAALSEKEELTDMSIQISSELKAVRAALKSVQSGAEELNRIRREHEIIDSLSRTANGMLPGKERITLESYVQSFYFERIIRRANIRLRMMSDGQYEFVRAGESGDKRHLSGLDLSVLDHYSGTERPVNTLSGGESFMASLSLALGLSDEVQASAGGIRLDTMFVDEGFGSLDSDTLEKAIRTLTELSDEDKLVGIISHVDALKTRIDKQIVVTKNRDEGSRAIVII